MADPLIQIERGFWVGVYFHGLEAVYVSFEKILEQTGASYGGRDIC
jgi:hypothetical protein